MPEYDIDIGEVDRVEEVDELDESEYEDLVPLNEQATHAPRPYRDSLDDLFRTDDEEEESSVEDAVTGTVAATAASPSEVSASPPRSGMSIPLPRIGAVGPSTRSRSHAGESRTYESGCGTASGSASSRRRPSSQRQRLRELASTSQSLNNDGDVRQPTASGSSSRPRPRRPTIVDLTADDSDEEEVVFMREDRPAGVNPPAPPARLQQERYDADGRTSPLSILERRREALNRPPVPYRNLAAPGRVQQALNEIEEALAARRREMRDLMEAENARRHRVQSPPPAADPAPRPRIGLGGAVLRVGDQQREYRHARPAGPEAGHQVRMAGNGRFAYVPEADAAGGEGFMDYLRRRVGQFGRRTLNGFEDVYNQYLNAYPTPPLPGAGVGAGPAAHRPIDVAAVIASIPNPSTTMQDPLPGFVATFDLDAVDPLGPIELDESDNVIPPSRKAALHCFVCQTKLRLSTNYRNDDDRVWRLRCGHLIDQRCLHALSTPHTSKELASVVPPITLLAVLDQPEPPRRGNKRRKVVKDVPREYTWPCPAKGCGRDHVSVRMTEDAKWVQRAGEGAVPLFM